MNKKIKVIIARLGMDAHWRGSVIVARALRDAGMEVIYLGNQLPESIVQIAIQEDVDAVGLSTLSGNHMLLAPEVVSGLKKKGMNQATVFVGGTIPPNDVPKLREKGVKAVFRPGTPVQETIDFINTACGYTPVQS